MGSVGNIGESVSEANAAGSVPQLPSLATGLFAAIVAQRERASSESNRGSCEQVKSLCGRVMPTSGEGGLRGARPVFRVAIRFAFHVHWQCRWRNVIANVKVSSPYAHCLTEHVHCLPILRGRALAIILQSPRVQTSACEWIRVWLVEPEVRRSASWLDSDVAKAPTLTLPTPFTCSQCFFCPHLTRVGDESIMMLPHAVRTGRVKPSEATGVCVWRWTRGDSAASVQTSVGTRQRTTLRRRCYCERQARRGSCRNLAPWYNAQLYSHPNTRIEW